MWRTCGRLLEIDFGIAERRQRLGGGLLELGDEILGTFDHPHAAAAAASACLQQQRKTDLGAGRLGRRRRRVAVFGAGDDGNAGGSRGLTRRDFVSHASDGVAVGTDEGQAGLSCRARRRRGSRRESHSRDRWRRISARAQSRSARLRSDSLISAAADRCRWRDRRPSDGRNWRRPNCRPQYFPARDRRQTRTARRAISPRLATSCENPPHCLVLRFSAGSKVNNAISLTILPNLLFNVRLASICFILQDFLFRFLVPPCRLLSGSRPGSQKPVQTPTQ